jgi:recombinational DNA repair ATPase RecF
MSEHGGGDEDILFANDKDDNFARLLRTRDTLLAENRDLQKQLAAVNDQLLEAQAVIRALRKTLRETSAFTKDPE